MTEKLADSQELFQKKNQTKLSFLEAFFIGKIEQLTENQQQFIDFLKSVPEAKFAIACGKGWFADPKLNQEKFNDQEITFSKLAPEAKLTCLAAAMLFISGKTENIIVTGGKTAGENNLSEAEAMKEFILKVFGKRIKETNIIVEGKAIDTAKNADNTLEIVNQDTATVLTIKYHLPRTKSLFSRIWQRQAIEQSQLTNEQITLNENNFLMLDSDEFIAKLFPDQRYLKQMNVLHPERMALETVREFFAKILYSNEGTIKFMQVLATLKRQK